MMKKAVKQLNFVGRFAARWEVDVKRARGACKVRPEKLVHGFVGTVGGWGAGLEVEVRYCVPSCKQLNLNCQWISSCVEPCCGEFMGEAEGRVWELSAWAGVLCRVLPRNRDEQVCPPQALLRWITG